MAHHVITVFVCIQAHPYGCFLALWVDACVCVGVCARVRDDVLVRARMARMRTGTGPVSTLRMEDLQVDAATLSSGACGSVRK
jgi:hypothetical protein